jgi:NitT/TauT family transport system substrate-binding protein
MGWSAFRALTSAAAMALALLQADAAGAQERLKAKIGVLRLASSGAVFIAADQKAFEKAGLDAELVFFDAAQPIAVAVASGDLDFGVTAFTAGMFNLAAKGGLKVVAGQSRETKGFPLIGYFAATHGAGASIASFRELAGKHIAITQTGSSFHYSLGLLSEKYGFPLTGMSLSPMQSLSNVVAALKGGSVDAALLPVTTAKPLIDSGDAKLLGWVGDETPWQLGAAMVSRRDFEKTALIEAFLAGYRQGARVYHDVLLNAAKDGAVPVSDATRPVLDIIAKYAQQSVDQVRVGLPYVDADAKLDVADVAHQIKWYQEQGFVDKAVTLDAVVDKRFVKE